MRSGIVPNLLRFLLSFEPGAPSPPETLRFGPPSTSAFEECRLGDNVSRRKERPGVSGLRTNSLALMPSPPISTDSATSPPPLPPPSPPPPPPLLPPPPPPRPTTTTPPQSNPQLCASGTPSCLILLWPQPISPPLQLPPRSPSAPEQAPPSPATQG